MISRMLLWNSIISLLSLGALVSAGAPATTKATKRQVKILNESGSKVEIYWVHPQTRVTTLMSTPLVLNGASFPIDSYVGHEFEVRELPSARGVCRSQDQICGSTIFAVSNNDDQVATISKGIEIEFIDDQIRAKLEAGELVKLCQGKAKARLDAAKGNTAEVDGAMDDLVSCIEEGVAATLSKANEEIAFQASIRKDIAQQMENYTCADLTMETSEAVETKIWRGSKDAKSREVKVMLDRPASKIHVVQNFVSPEECLAMEEAAKPKLHRATVADGKGGSHFSEHRKAKQAGIAVPWSKEADGDHIAILSRRVYDYSEYVLGLGITEHGQEDLMSIQYFGRGANDTAPDRYMPHCDGDCTGLPHKSGSRMATVVMYCNIPEIGGHTNFRNAGVHVKPNEGSAIFFSYIDPEERVMDSGFTEHSGCPVFVGEKKIVTQWVRLGVDDENPWDSYDTLGIKVGEEDEDDEDDEEDKDEDDEESEDENNEL